MHSKVGTMLAEMRFSFLALASKALPYVNKILLFASFLIDSKASALYRAYILPAGKAFGDPMHFLN